MASKRMPTKLCCHCNTNTCDPARRSIHVLHWSTQKERWVPWNDASLPRRKPVALPPGHGPPLPQGYGLSRAQRGPPLPQGHGPPLPQGYGLSRAQRWDDFVHEQLVQASEQLVQASEIAALRAEVVYLTDLVRQLMNPNPYQDPGADADPTGTPPKCGAPQ